MRSDNSNYDAAKVEKKWQEKWARTSSRAGSGKAKKKYYNLVMFPYPSGDKLHIGHWYNFAPADSHGRFMRMHGHDVFEPMGFDSFGLPAENYAIKTGVHPTKSIKKNVEKMVEQLSRIGAMYDWDKTLATSDPEYYKWTQWLFLKMYENGLAYKKKQGVNWCPSCQTVLANEQVEDGACERCKSDVEKKDLEQWFWKITDYAEKLLDYKGLDWPENTKAMQENWIGKSKGVNINFPLCDEDKSKHEVNELVTYTTRPDTIFSVTFIVIAPEHPLVDKFVEGTKYEKTVKNIRKQIDKQTLIERTSEGGTDKLGCYLGVDAINPVNGEKIPVYLANFALMYGTGVVMADAHDQRDFEFAGKYGIDLKFVISEDGKKTSPAKADRAYVEDGVLFDSGEFDGMNNREALPKIAIWMEKKKMGEKAVNYKLRDWLVSRQRYWGAPIPIIYCKKCGEVPVPEKDLPVELPLDVKFELRGDGKSPLAHSRKFMNVLCPKCGAAAKRESDTMDTFVCSSWYYLRYPSMGSSAAAKKVWSKNPFDPAVTKKMLPVDMYIGGPEHACMHLLYARFVNMVLNDLGYVDFKEPFKRLVHQGMVTKDGAKMSKSKGNVVSPDGFVDQYGSDVFRMYLMFMGPFTQGGDWNDKGIKGIARFVDKFWAIVDGAVSDRKVSDKDGLRHMLHKTIKKVSRDVEKFHFNTAISALMEFVNAASVTGADLKTARVAVQLIAPMAPHLAEECWTKFGEKESVFESKWPKFNPEYVVESTVTYAIQVNGKMRGTVDVAADAGQADVVTAARELPTVAKYLAEGKIVKEIFVPGKIVGFVVK
jgi:leucyl-tRNA synthetase